MNSKLDDLAFLAARVRHGDSTASARLQEQMEPAAMLVVRRALRTGAGASAFNARMIAEAKRVAPNAAEVSEAPREALIGRVARRLTESVVRSLRKNAPRCEPMKETIRN